VEKESVLTQEIYNIGDRKMNKIFAEMFSKEPPYIVDGDYFYFNPYWEEYDDENRKYYEKIVENKKDSGRWRELWESRTFQREFETPLDKLNHGTNIRTFGQMYDAINIGASKIHETFSKIAAENKPVMDISSCNTFGLIPFILEFNPQLLCMATDMEAPFTRIMRSTVNQELANHNISLASFDNRDIPIKDNSLDYVTSTGGIGGATDGNNASVFGEEKVISEVYRILRPGGRYVTIEIEEWHDQFIAAGFQVEIEKNQGNIFYVLRKPN
jgi:SAM-dependent methyltransferase